MIATIECPRCHGEGECHTATPSQRARYVRYDDLSPDDYTEQCPMCGGTGAVEHDLNEEIEPWMN